MTTYSNDTADFAAFLESRESNHLNLAQYISVGITTPLELIREELITDIVECYKETHNIKPAHYDFSNMTLEQLQEMSDSFNPNYSEEKQRQDEITAQKVIRKSYVANNPFANLKSLIS
jgi:hypothetical protein